MSSPDPENVKLSESHGGEKSRSSEAVRDDTLDIDVSTTIRGPELDENKPSRTRNLISMRRKTPSLRGIHTQVDQTLC